MGERRRSRVSWNVGATQRDLLRPLAPVIAAVMFTSCLPADYPDSWSQLDPDGDGYPTDEDCDSGDPAVNPGRAEDCSNGVDDNCDGFVDAWDQDCGLVWPGEDWVQVSAGANITCGHHEDGTVDCIGDIQVDGIVDDSDMGIPLGQTFDLIDVWGNGVCGVTPVEHAIVCPAEDDEPVAPPGGPYVQIARGMEQVCTLDTEGFAHCWSLEEEPADQPPAGERFLAISASGTTACGVLESSGAIICWPQSYFADLAPAGERFTQIALGYFQACALTRAGAIRCWGCSGPFDMGQCDAPADEGYVQISAGYTHSCALHESDRLECWGCQDSENYANPNGGFGECETEGRSPVQQMDTGFDLGDGHTCALQEIPEPDGARRAHIRCWGVNYSGQSWEY